MASLIVDTGFLVALGRSADPLHPGARAFFLGRPEQLLTVVPVLTESCFFLRPHAKIELLALAQSGRMKILDIPLAAYGEIGRVVAKYADRDIDFTDAALVWLANHSGVRHILTTDANDFGIYRLKGNKRFEVVKWFD